MSTTVGQVQNQKVRERGWGRVRERGGEGERGREGGGERLGEVENYRKRERGWGYCYDTTIAGLSFCQRWTLGHPSPSRDERRNGDMKILLTI